jgi:hypothetical protein
VRAVARYFTVGSIVSAFGTRFCQEDDTRRTLSPGFTRGIP